MPKPFEADQKSFEELMLEGKSAYAIPLYQRRYVWRAEQNRKLWDDVVDCYEQSSNHFLGSLVLMGYVKDEYDQKYQADELVENAYTVSHVVDGQQRLTSLSLILAALYSDMLEVEPYFKAAPDLDAQDSQDWDTLKSKMRSCLLTSERDRQSKTGKGYIPRLIPVKVIYEPYKTIVNQEGCGKQLLVEKAYRLHLDNVRELRRKKLPSTVSGDNDCEQCDAWQIYSFYNKMFIAIANHMKIIRIDCAADEDAFQVFESLNGTGLSLSSSDRIKNYLMQRGSREINSVPASKVESEWQQIDELVGRGSNLESFFSSYLFSYRGERVPKKNLLTVFREFYSEYGSAKKVINQLKRAADYYGTIVNQTAYQGEGGVSKQLSSDTKVLLKSIAKNNPSQSIVPLLATAMRFGIDSTEFVDVAKRLLVLLVRHKVCQRSTNELDRYFEKYCKTLKDQPLVDALAILRSKQPDDRQFRLNFESMAFNADQANDSARARYYLEAIENYLRNKRGDCNLDPNEELTLEHVIPQTFDPDSWFADYPADAALFHNEDDGKYQEEFSTNVIQSIGNMCLLRKPENSSAGNSAFDMKLKSYEKPDESGKTASDTFCLVGQIVNNCMDMDGKPVTIVGEGHTFDSDSVDRRARVLAEYAVEIWS